MGNGYLDKGYEAGEADDARALYARWAASCDAEISENGYAAPSRVAAALKTFVKDQSRPVLDFGCGTGLGGLALKLAGFSTVDGIDVTPEVIEKAQEKGIYRTLGLTEPNAPFRITPCDYGAIAAIGVIGVGAAPISTFDTIMTALPKGGLFAFSLNDHALADPKFEAKVNEYVDCTAARLLFRKHGDHLPGINLKSIVYVIEKL